MYFDSFFHMQTFELLCFHNLASRKNKVEEPYTGHSFYVLLMLCKVEKMKIGIIKFEFKTT